MEALDNSRRSFNQATYTPLKPINEEKRLNRTWEKASFVARLNLTLAEVFELIKASQQKGSDIKEFLELIKTIIPESGRMNLLRNASKFREVSAEIVSQFGELVIEFRRSKVKEAIRALDQIAKSHSEKPGEKKAKVKATEVQNSSNVLAMLKSYANSDSELASIAQWIINILEVLSIIPISFEMLKSILKKMLAIIEAAVEGFKVRMTVQPVGSLHLEKLSFTPQAIERGELLYSLALAPKEEINMIHKEWSNTTTEFERIEQSFQEEYSEEGVSEKSELAESTNSQEQHSDTLSASVNVSGSYGPTRVSASTSAGISDSDSLSRQSSVKQSSEFTSKASSRSKKEHKISFKVTSASGEEDQSVRKIINPYEQPKRVDYYQLVRKWKVDLHRYGLRLTYDIVIPEPGIDILTKIIELSNINNELEKSFEMEFSPSEIDRSNWQDKSDTYHVSIDPPPDEEKEFIKQESHSWPNILPTATMFQLDFDIGEDYYVIELELGEFRGASSVFSTNSNWYVGWVGGSYLEGREFGASYDPPDPDNPHKVIGLSGKISVFYYANGLVGLVAEAKVTAKLKDSVFLKWQVETWNKIKETRETDFNNRRNLLEQQKQRLLEELGVDDPLTLRKKEREEVMKAVLRWLIPGFEFWPAGMPCLEDWSSSAAPEDVGDSPILTDEERMFVLEHGEFIKFIHHAVEWENMLYFLYPYFWGHPERWEMKKYLKHPNLLHEVFLRSGSARVVLTIRPGFEKPFLYLMATGDPNVALEADNPYFSIAQEYEAYANTNYPGLKPANPETNSRPLILAEQQTTWKKMQKIMHILDEYKASHGVYPHELSDLPDFSDDAFLKDAWDNEFYYKYPGAHNEYDLASWGKDGDEGGENLEDLDITNWAESNWIGTWFEYVPTGAMDIAWGDCGPDNMPEA